MRKRLRECYEVLGLDPDASPEEVRSAYRRLAREFHPDVTASSDASRFREIREAYEALSDRAPAADSVASSRTSFRSRATGLWRGTHLEIVLSPQEAARGGEVRLEAAVERACSGCAGTGRGFFLLCPDCRGVGRRREYRLLSFRIPPGIEHGARVSADAGAGRGYVTATIAIGL